MPVRSTQSSLSWADIVKNGLVTMNQEVEEQQEQHEQEQEVAVQPEELVGLLEKQATENNTEEAKGSVTFHPGLNIPRDEEKEETQLPCNEEVEYKERDQRHEPEPEPVQESEAEPYRTRKRRYKSHGRKREPIWVCFSIKTLRPNPQSLPECLEIAILCTDKHLGDRGFYHSVCKPSVVSSTPTVAMQRSRVKHQESGLWDECLKSWKSCETVDEELCKFILRISDQNPQWYHWIPVGHSLRRDLQCMERDFPQFSLYLSKEVVDLTGMQRCMGAFLPDLRFPSQFYPVQRAIPDAYNTLQFFLFARGTAFWSSPLQDVTQLSSILLHHEFYQTHIASLLQEKSTDSASPSHWSVPLSYHPLPEEDKHLQSYPSFSKVVGEKTSEVETNHLLKRTYYSPLYVAPFPQPQVLFQETTPPQQGSDLLQQPPMHYYSPQQQQQQQPQPQYYVGSDVYQPYATTYYCNY